MACNLDWLRLNAVTPSHMTCKHGPGYNKYLLEGGGTKYVQYMDMIKINKSINRRQEPTIDYQKLCKQWFMKYSDILSGVPPELSPLHEINHRIPLINEDKWYTHRLPWCPKAMQPQLLEKLWVYSDAGWWMPKAVPQAMPLLCIPKKTGKLRMVIDCHQWNDNIIKDVTPFLDQDEIWMNVA